MIMHNMIVAEEQVDSVYDQKWDFQSELIEPLRWSVNVSRVSPCPSQSL
jgi:hypothetical protein